MRIKKITGLIVFSLLFLGVVFFLKSYSGSTEILWRLSDGGQRLMPLVSVAAILDSLNPCAFSVLLLTIAFLFSLGALRPNILKIGAFYILGLFLAYLAIGLGLLGALHLFSTPHFMGKLGAVLLLSLGVINLINHFFPAFPLKFKIPAMAHGKIAGLMEKSSLPAAFALGALVGLCEFPCTGGPYLAVLGLLHDSQTYSRGVAYLLWYNLLFVLPLILILALSSDQTALTKAKAWRGRYVGRLKLIDGLIMIALGLLFFFI